MSDILTFEETKGLISNKIISWLGDGNNNMSNSLIEAAGKFGFQLKIGRPTKYMPNKKILSWYEGPMKALQDFINYIMPLAFM